MSQPLISVAVPIHNGERYLAEALDSLQAQSHPHWEALLWDDGSDDGSHDIAATYAAADRRFRLHGDGTRRGTAGALAAALPLARGDYLATLDCDDVLEPDALASMTALLEQRPDAGMAYSQHVETDAQGRTQRIGARCLVPYSPQRLLTDFMCFQFRLYRADAYRAVGGFDPQAALAEDYDLCLRLSERYPVLHQARPLHRYRQLPGSLSHRRRLEQVQASHAAAQRALLRRGMSGEWTLSLGIRARHVLVPRAGGPAP